MAWNTNSQREYLTKQWNALSLEERRRVPLEQFIQAKMQEKSDIAVAGEHWGKNLSGKMSGDLADMFMGLYGDKKFHGGGIGGVDRQLSGGVMNEYRDFAGPDGFSPSPFGNRWLGPENPLTLNPNQQRGSQVTFKRDVSPYMMYRHPNTPEKWDEIEAGPSPSDSYYTSEMRQNRRILERQDIADETMRKQIKSQLLRSDPQIYKQLVQQGTLDQAITELMKQQGGG